MNLEPKVMGRRGFFLPSLQAATSPKETLTKADEERGNADGSFQITQVVGYSLGDHGKLLSVVPSAEIAILANTQSR
jgi:hypothetical protein